MNVLRNDNLSNIFSPFFQDLSDEEPFRWTKVSSDICVVGLAESTHAVIG